MFLMQDIVILLFHLAFIVLILALVKKVKANNEIRTSLWYQNRIYLYRSNEDLSTLKRSFQHKSHCPYVRRHKV